jgi:hypothetical protein
VWLRSFADDGPIDISVCIANWNGREMLRRCLESLHDIPQGVRLEIIVVDNASTDGAAEMVARDFPEAILIRNPTNAGFARASNQAAARASGHYLLFLNNDTELPPFALGKLVAFADEHPEAGMIGPRLRDAHGNVQISYRRKPTLATLLHRTALVRASRLFRRSYREYRRERFDPEHRGSVEMLMGAAVLMPRRVFEDGGKWDEDFRFGGEDLELSARVGQRHALLYHPDVEVTHLGRVSSRDNVGFATEGLMAGYVLYLRKIGTSRAALNLYKLAVTLDAPCQLVIKSIEGIGRRLAGRSEKAAKSWLAAKGQLHFLKQGLIRFWRA